LFVPLARQQDQVAGRRTFEYALYGGATIDIDREVAVYASANVDGPRGDRPGDGQRILLPGVIHTDDEEVAAPRS
jgi:hypothetical protein